MGSKLFRSRPISTYEQLAYMKLYHPSFVCQTQHGILVCRGNIQPTPLHETYRVGITYRVGHAPQAWVEAPQLHRRQPEEPIPHTYSDDRPCLYLPGTGEWAPEKALACTIIPWLSLWLFFYEAWLVTGAWQGGGVHPPKLPRTKIQEADTTS